MTFVEYHSSWDAASTPVVALDVGGSRVRWGVIRPADGRLQVEAGGDIALPSQMSQPQSLVEGLIGLASPLLQRVGLRSCAISLGVAMDARNGAVLGSGPMWGGASSRAMLVERELVAAKPSVNWCVQNDLTAHALGVMQTCPMPDTEKIAILNLGTGIAFRTLQLQPLGIWVDTIAGLQGEVGHLPAECRIDGVPLNCECECGEMNHLSSFAAGPAIARILEDYAPRYPFLACVQDKLAAFTAAVAEGNSSALYLLDCLMSPVAVQIRQILTIDPEIGRIFLVGGVSDGLGKPLLASLRRQFATNLLPYGLSNGHEKPLGELLAQVPASANTALLGAAHSMFSSSKLNSRASAWHLDGSRFMSQEVLLEPGCVRDRESESLHRELARRLTPGRPVLIFVDSELKPDQVMGLTHLVETVSSTPVVTVELGLTESQKTFDSAAKIIDWFERSRVDRRTTQILAIGGGVVLDVVGYAASQYRRGVPYVVVPSTLVGMIDAGVALKRSLNVANSKHRIGAYWPPSLTIIDPRLLRSLPPEQYSYGLAEAIKVALIADATLFNLIEAHSENFIRGRANESAEDELVRRSLDVMLAQLRRNPFEHELRRPVDLGHSFISQLELDSTRPMPHGLAVAFDIALTATLSHLRELLQVVHLRRILRVLDRCGLYPTIDLRSQSLAMASLAETSLHRMGQKLPLLQDIGVKPIFVDDVTSDEVGLALSMLAGGQPE